MHTINARVILISAREARIMYNSKQLPGGYATPDELSNEALTVYKIENVPGYRIKR